MLNNYLESWLASNANWTYDGDELFNPLHTAALSTVAVFNPPTSLFNPYPLIPTAMFPLKLRNRFRAITAGVGTIPFFTATVSFDAGFSADYIALLFFYTDSTHEYVLEVFGTKGGVPYNVNYGTGIPLSADRFFTSELIVTPTGYTAIVEGVALGSDAGWTFPQVGYIDAGIQRNNALNQGELYETQIETNPAAGGAWPLGVGL